MVKIGFRLILIAVVVSAFSAGAFAQERLKNLGWLAGCWTANMDGALYEECWTASSAGFMQGSGRMTESGKITMREHMTIEAEADGSVVMYVLQYNAALKSDQPVVGFKLVSEKNGRFTFENPKHDYPQRIIYEKHKDGSATARIEALDGSKPFDFPLKRPGGKKK